MSRYLVTGGAGFIGSNLVAELVKRKQKVVVLDNLSSGKLKNLKPFGNKVRFIKGDIRNLKDCKKAVRGVDYVHQVAALRAVLRSVDNPAETNDVNVGGILNILVAARDSQVKRVVFSSSSSVYGNTKKFPVGEQDPIEPESPYAATKVMGEYYHKLFFKLYGLETVCLRYFNVFGPNQNPESKYSAVIPIVLDCLLKGKSPEIHWDGKQSRDFSYIDNVVSGNLLAARAKGAAGKVFNIACHEEYSVLDILHSLQKITGTKHIKPHFKPKRAGDVRRTYADISQSKKILKFKVQTRFQPGLEKTVEWFLKSGLVGRK
jgi:nucleoside-diphosphate-sugar epimerase